MAVEAIDFGGRTAWRKQYEPAGERRLRLAMLAALMRRLGIGALLPPPHRCGAEACAIELRRLRELDAIGVRVPELIAADDAALVLGDLGRTFASRLRAAAGDDDATDALVQRVVDAIAEVHARSGYLGQPSPRNVAIDDHGRVGFLDFEEDPLAVMSLDEAQARDWLMFAFGVARYYDGREDALVALLAPALKNGPAGVVREARSVGRLRWPARALRWLGRSARQVAHSVLVVHAATTLPVLAVAVLLADWLHDGDLDLLRALL